VVNLGTKSEVPIYTHYEDRKGNARSRPEGPGTGLTVIAASVHGLFSLPAIRIYKLLASGSVEIKRTGFW